MGFRARSEKTGNEPSTINAVLTQSVDQSASQNTDPGLPSPVLITPESAALKAMLVNVSGLVANKARKDRVRNPRRIEGSSVIGISSLLSVYGHQSCLSLCRGVSVDCIGREVMLWGRFV